MDASICSRAAATERRETEGVLTRRAGQCPQHSDTRSQSGTAGMMRECVALDKYILQLTFCGWHSTKCRAGQI